MVYIMMYRRRGSKNAWLTGIVYASENAARSAMESDNLANDGFEYEYIVRRMVW